MKQGFKLHRLTHYELMRHLTKMNICFNKKSIQFCLHLNMNLFNFTSNHISIMFERKKDDLDNMVAKVKNIYCTKKIPV
jgi:hypothetical protein